MNIVLKRAFEEVMSEEFDKIPNDAPFNISKVFEKKMKKLIKAESRPFYRLTFTKSRKIACIIAAILVIMLSSLSVGAVRDAFKEFFVKTFSTHYRISYDKKDTKKQKDYPKEIKKVYEFGFVPSDFELVDFSKTDTSVDTTYVNGDYIIVFSQYTKDAFDVNIDNERLVKSNETINGQEYVVNREKNGELRSLIWDNGEYIFMLTSYASEDDTFKMIDSMRVK